MEGKIIAVLDDIKTIKGSTEDNLISIYMRRGTTLIKKYLNDYTIDVEIIYPDALITFCTECLNKKGNEGMSQFTQGSINGTYQIGLSEDVKALLPLPKVIMMG